MSLKDIYNDMITKEAEYKMDHVRELYGEDQERIQVFDRALDLLKEAEEKGTIRSLSPSEKISLAFEVTEEEMAEKDAEAWRQIGETVSELLRDEFDITKEDIEKMSDEEAEEFGVFCARLYATAVTGDNYIGDYAK
jgi:hypothetical protein